MTPQITLDDGVRIPQLGYGVFQIPQEKTARSVEMALDAGYRSIDTAAAYGNEEAVGKAVQHCGIGRDELFVTTKLWNSDHGYDATLAAFDASLTALGMDYVDLYLIHWPVPERDLYTQSWRALERIRSEGRARAIGVSNFHIPHLRKLLGEADVPPAINQIELHPRLQQHELRRFHEANGIVTEAWSPLAKGEVLEDGRVTGLAGKYGKTPAQIVLRWHIQLGNVVRSPSLSSGSCRTTMSSTSSSTPKTWRRSVSSTTGPARARTPTRSTACSGGYRTGVTARRPCRTPLAAPARTRTCGTSGRLVPARRPRRGPGSGQAGSRRPRRR